MSSTAPWLALAVDWDESEMWDSLPQYGIEDESTMGERLAWVCLMCDAKRKGRGGKVSVRKTVFQKHHRLTGRAVDGMLSRAQKCGAVEINGDFITLCNWRTYQQKMGGAKSFESPVSPKIKENAPTNHTSHITNHTSQQQPPTPVVAAGSAEPEPLSAGWSSLVVDLHSEGMDFAQDACEKSRSKGNSIAEVRLLLDHWREHRGAWQIGTLYNKICSMVEGRKVLWPEPAEEYKRLAKQTESKTTTLRQLTDREDARRGRQSAAEERAELESRFGAELDAMSKKKLREFVQLRLPMLTSFIPPRGRAEGMLRDALLTELAGPAKQSLSIPWVQNGDC